MLNPRHLWFGPSFWNSHIANGRILWHLQSTHWFHRLLKGTAKESPWHLLVTIRVSCKCSLEISWIHWVWLRDRDAVCQGVVVQTQLKEQFSVAWRIFDGERFVFSTKLPPWFLRSLPKKSGDLYGLHRAGAVLCHCDHLHCAFTRTWALGVSQWYPKMDISIQKMLLKQCIFGYPIFRLTKNSRTVLIGDFPCSRKNPACVSAWEWEVNWIQQSSKI